MMRVEVVEEWLFLSFVYGVDRLVYGNRCRSGMIYIYIYIYMERKQHYLFFPIDVVTLVMPMRTEGRSDGRTTLGFCCIYSEYTLSIYSVLRSITFHSMAISILGVLDIYKNGYIQMGTLVVGGVVVY